MKKIVALVLCLVLALSLCTVAMAKVVDYTAWEYNTTTSAYEKDADVTQVEFVAGTKPYSVGTTNYPGTVDYYVLTISGTGTNYVVVSDAADATYMLVDSSVTKVDATTKKIYLAAAAQTTYEAEAVAYTTNGTTCDQLTATLVANATNAKLDLVTYTVGTTTYVASTVAAGTTYNATNHDLVLYKGEVTIVDPYGAQEMVQHIWNPSAFDKTGDANTYTCALCKTVAKAYKTELAAKEAGSKTVVALANNNTYGFIGYGVVTTAGTTATVESAKTFDAGIALYAGMALASVAGSAVVIGKKKEF